MEEYRSIDGTGNNLNDTDLGSTHEQLLRVSQADYGDGISTLAGAGRPSAREVSNALSSQSYDLGNGMGHSDMLWVWGQFLDHDITLTPSGAENGTAPIAVPAGDPWFDPQNTGTQTIDFNRSIFDETTGTDSPRQQVNEITSWIDASNVYGSNEERAAALRNDDGTMKTSDDDLLPYNVDGLPNDMTTSATHFLAGDVRANENAALTSIHTVFVREHNRIVEELRAENPELTGDELYQQARSIVGAEIQAITYNEFLPKLIGRDALEDYNGYDATIDPSIANEFSTVAFRVGHTMLSRQLERFQEDGTVNSGGHLDLSQAFFNPSNLTAEGGIEDILRGSAASLCNEVDANIVDDVRNLLFGAPGSGGMDLVALNIQRGRDHGISDYNSMREAYGLDRVTSFAEITSDVELQARLEELYGSVDNIDAFIGGLAEDHAEGASVGELFQTAIAEQFTRLRDGDRFWFENQMDAETIAEIQNTTLSDVLLRTTSIEHLQEDAFTAYTRTGGSDGDDDLYIGGEQNDLVFGGNGNDSIASNIGNDHLMGEAGNDRLFGGAHDDLLQGGAGADQLHGEADNDRLEGGAGNDFLNGGTGHDRLDGGEGNDYLLGGVGADRFVFSAGQDVIGDFVKGDDKVDFSAWDLVDDIDDVAITSYSGSGSLLEDSAGNSLWLAGVSSVSVHDFLFEEEYYEQEESGISGGANEALIGTSGDDLFIDTDGVQYVHGQEGHDRFKVDANRDEWNIGRTQDQQDWVIWNDQGEFNVLFDVEEIQFNDELVALNDAYTV